MSAVDWSKNARKRCTLAPNLTRCAPRLMVVVLLISKTFCVNCRGARLELPGAVQPDTVKTPGRPALGTKNRVPGIETREASRSAMAERLNPNLVVLTMVFENIF